MAETSASTEAIDVSENHDGGIRKLIKVQGTGNEHPSRGDTVNVHYVGTLEDGTQFDSSRDRGEPFSFTLGKGQVIKAWDQGVATMRKGELSVFTCQSEYAYGENGSPPKIPPNATLIFEVELLNWEGEDISPDKDKTIMRSIQKEGDKWETPNDGSLMDVRITGKYHGHTFIDQDFLYPLGECTELDLPEGVDRALKRFRIGEKSLILLKPKWAYGKVGKPEWNIPADAELEFIIHCKAFEKTKETWQMNADEKLEEAEKAKERGTIFFQQNKIKMAISKYKRAIDLLQFEKSIEDEAKKAKRNQIYHAAHLNISLCLLKNGDSLECIKHCEKVLEENENNVKALFRRGQANQNIGEYDEAIKDFTKVLQFEPENKAAMASIQQCKAKVREQLQKDKAIFGNMFEKFARSDAKRKSSDQNDEKSANGNEEEEEEDVMQIATEGKIVGEGVVDPEGIVRTKQVEAGNADSTTGTNTGDD